MPDAAGQPVAGGRYILQRPIGKGAMGIVWEAVHVALDRRVAIKLLHPHMMERSFMAERFQREAKLASLLRHRNTVQLLDFGNDGPVFYLVMELLEGQDLAEVVLDEGAIDPVRAVTIMAQAAAALAAAHDKGIVHRDMKPSNIMLVRVKDDDGRDVEVVKVLDFGIAKLTHNDLEETQQPMLTMDGDVCGTPEYMSPEQAEGRKLDARTDIYACGIMLYQLLAGDVPFIGDTPLSTMIKQVSETARPLREVNPTVTPELEAVVMKALAKKREARYPDARALRADLLALLTSNTGLGVAAAAAGATSGPAFGPLTTSPRAVNVGSAPTDERPSLLGQSAASRRTGRARIWLGLAGIGALAAAAVAVVISNRPAPQDPQSFQAQGLAGGALPTEARPQVAIVPEVAPTDGADAEIASATADTVVPDEVSVANAAAEDAVAALPPVEVAKADPEPPDEPVVAVAEPVAVTTKVVSPKAPARVTLPAHPELPKTPVGTVASTAPKPVTEGPGTVVQTEVAAKPEPPPVEAKAEPVAVVKPVVETPPPKPALAPSLVADASEGGWSVDGSLPPSAIQRAVARQRETVEACYADAARAARRDVAGSVKVSFVIDVDGQARDVKVGSFGLPGVSACVSAAMARVRTRERPDTGTVATSFNLRFTPRQP